MTKISELRRFDKYIVWGLRKKWHSHRFIHQHFNSTLKKLGLPVIWVDDMPENNELIGKNDLVITADVAAKHLNTRKEAYYVLHNFGPSNGTIPPERHIRLQVYTRAILDRTGIEKWGSATFFDPGERILFQPWGTDLLQQEFYRPVSGAVRRNKLAFWIGSVWNNSQNQGNLNEIAELKAALRNVGKTFIKVRFIPNTLNTHLIRSSCIAPAIAGRWQVDNDYLPCRMFKNISYGHLGLSNVAAFDTILADSAIKQHDISSMIEFALSLTNTSFSERIAEQQKRILDHTYDKKILCFIRALDSKSHLTSN